MNSVADTKQKQQFAKFYNQLNPQQRLAVDTTEGPVLVVAGPGTGKTQVLAMRIANILNTKDISPGDILCLTFTESGVAAMRKRLSKIISSAAYYVNIHTFHSFCNEVIQTFPDKFAEFSGNPKQLDDLNRIKIIRQILDDLPQDKKYHLRLFHNPYYHQREILSSIQTLKREGIPAPEFTKIAADNLEELENNPDINQNTGKPKQKYQRQLKFAERNVELAEIYAAYQAELDERNFYDYEDMILYVIEHFAEDDELVAFYRENFLYIHVDEYQDTNGSQNKLIKLLGMGSPENKPNIFAVGDDDQAIYRFQGANVENLLFFEQQFAGVQTVAITTNYRSNQAILDFAAESIKNNQNRLTKILPDLEKNLNAGLDQKEIKPKYAELATGFDENEFVIKKIRELVSSGVSYDEIAILYRKHSDAEDIIDDLLRAQIPIKLSAGGDVLAEKPVQHLVKILQLVNFPAAESDDLLFEILFYHFLRDKFQIPRVDVFRLLAYVNKQNYFVKNIAERISLFNSLQDVKLLEQAGIETPKPFLELHQAIVNWKAAEVNMGLTEFMANLMQESGLFAHTFGGELNIEEANALNSFFQFAKKLHQQQLDINLRNFLADLHLLEENSLTINETKMDLDQDSVNLMTAHGAKGLEFKNVFIIKAYHRNWGGRISRSSIHLPEEVFELSESKEGSLASQVDLDDKELAEEDERRLFFVAATRAKQRLFISTATEYVSADNTREVEPTKFIKEVSAETFDKSNIQEASTTDVERLQRNLSPKIEPDLDAAEQDFLKSLVDKFRLSASALNEYIECPLKFKFNRLLRAPLPPSTHIALGNATHKALELLGRRFMEDPNYQIDQDLVLLDFELALRNELLSAEDYKLTLTEGNHILETYLNEYAGSFQVPAAVEYSFGKHNVVLEMSSQEPVVLSGKIDKIEWVGKAENRVRIVDYKTSSYKTENYIRGNTKVEDKNIWRQLVFYVLMAGLDDYFRPPNKMSKYVVDHVQVDFLKESRGKLRKVNITIAQDDVADLRREIAQVMSQIRQLNFYGTEEYPLCGECDYCGLLAG